MTPMHCAAQYGHKEVAEWFFSVGASFTDRDQVYCYFFLHYYMELTIGQIIFLFFVVLFIHTTSCLTLFEP